MFFGPFSVGRMNFFVSGLILMSFRSIASNQGHFARTASARQRFTRQNVHGEFRRGRPRRQGEVLLMPLAVIVVLEIFENIADVQEGVAVQANVYEGRLHAWKDAGDFAFVDAADKREFLFALDIN